MKHLRTAMLITALATLAFFTACSPPQGPAGRVVDKDRAYFASSKIWRYRLTTETAQGERTEFRVPGGAYRRCYIGSAYPQCTQADR
ncbi:hypothetical protein ACWGIR_22845 [Streptomyces albidoflavus]